MTTLSIRGHVLERRLADARRRPFGIFNPYLEALTDGCYPVVPDARLRRALYRPPILQRAA